jgi:hypothetical protein
MKKKYENGQSIRAIRRYLLLWAGVSTLALVLYYLFHVRNNLFLFHFFTPAGYACLCAFFSGLFHTAGIKKIIRHSVWIFTVLCILLSAFIQTVKMINSYAVLIESILVIIWGLLYLHQVFISEATTRPHTELLFWICTGLLLHFIGKLFIQGTMNYLIRHNIELAKEIYNFDYYFDYLLLICIITGVFSKVIFKTGKPVQHIY